MQAYRTTIRTLTALALALGVSACAATPENAVTRAATMDAPQAPASMAVNIKSVRVSVPEMLAVSEANSYYPAGDIVWRGDPAGDRHAQVAAIFQEAMTRGTQSMKSGVPAILDVQVQRFHAQTEKARYSVGGVHDMAFLVTLRDPASGAALSQPRRIKAALKGYGGSEAIAAEQRGETQKVRITEHLASVIQQELIAPGSYKPENLGLMAMFSSN
ncbi:DUF6778 family protein [Roseovarius aquimarinus]|uniref:DUF6778 family protein n=1 Tax=Roseovarius aquimarinus TaxID=1229156 RepID=A0ABW7I3T8_9RHOB